MKDVIAKAEEEAWDILFGECTLKILPAQIAVYLENLQDFSSWELANIKRLTKKFLFQNQQKKPARVFGAALSRELERLAVDKTLAQQLVAWLLLFDGLSYQGIVEKINQKYFADTFQSTKLSTINLKGFEKIVFVSQI